LQAEGRAALVVRRIFTIGWFIWLIDFATKVWAQNTLSTREPIRVIGSFLQLTYVENSGAAFSLGTSSTIIFSLIALATATTITYYAKQITSHGWAVVLGLVLGGVFGNLTDRIFREPAFLRGSVIDWIQLPHWPVFNIADSAIVIAASIAVVLSARNITPIARAK
jgi:signal peptidase II